MKTTQPTLLRRWTFALETIRRRSRRAGIGEAEPALNEVITQCLEACDGILQEIAVNERETDQLRRDIAIERDSWQLLFEAMPAACIVTDAGGMILRVNRAGALLLNVSSAHLQGRPFSHFIVDRQRFIRLIESGAAARSPVRTPLRIRPREKAMVETEIVVVSRAGIQEGGW